MPICRVRLCKLNVPRVTLYSRLTQPPASKHACSGGVSAKIKVVITH